MAFQPIFPRNPFIYRHSERKVKDEGKIQIALHLLVEFTYYYIISHKLSNISYQKSGAKVRKKKETVICFPTI